MASMTDRYIASRLATLRRQRVGPIRLAAHKAGVPLDVWKSWEAGKSQPNWNEWPRVYEALRITHRQFWEKWGPAAANAKPIKFRGKTYPSIRAAAEAWDIAESTVRYHLGKDKP